MNWLDHIRWDADGLVPVIAQEAATGDVLMFAWMNREALARTAECGQAVYFSRSRRKLWHKGEESGHFQVVHEIRLDCDQDVLLLKITQQGHEPGQHEQHQRHLQVLAQHAAQTGGVVAHRVDEQQCVESEAACCGGERWPHRAHESGAGPGIEELLG